MRNQNEVGGTWTDCCIRSSEPYVRYIHEKNNQTINLVDKTWQWGGSMG